MSADRHPVAFEELVDYSSGDLAGDTADALEEHLFDCSVCAGMLEDIDRTAAAVRAAARQGAVIANVTSAFLERAVSDGLLLREYRLEQGASVACSGGVEDYVLVRLAADFAGAGRLQLHAVVENLETGQSMSLPAREVTPDVDVGEVLLVFPGSMVRTYPRSLWTLTVEAGGDGQPSAFGPFVMDHTP